MLVNFYFSRGRVSLEHIVHSGYSLAFADMLNKLCFLDLVIDGKVIDRKELVKGLLSVLLECSVNKLLFPVLVCGIECDLLKSNAETKSALLVF